MTVDIVCRISTDRTGEAAGVARQEADCRAYATQRHLDIAQTHIDNDISASGLRRRPGYEAMVERVKNGDIGGVVVWHLDRLYRRPRELEDLVDLVEATGLVIYTVTGGDYDLSTSDGRMMARVVTAAARKESEDKSRRIRRKHEELAQAGKVHGGGHRPFGYQTDRATIDVAEADLIRDAARRILAGDTMRSILTDWAARGVTAPTGRPWTWTPLRRTLTAPRLAGLRQNRGVVVGPAAWPAILDEITWRRLRAVLLDPNRRTSPGGARRYLLTGLAHCGLCDARLVARPRSDGRRCYVCASGVGFTGCGKIRRLADPVEEHVASQVFEALRGADLTALRPDRTGTEVHAAIDADEEALRDLARDRYAARIIGHDEYLAARDAITARLDRHRQLVAHDARRAVAATWSGQGDQLRDEWETLTVERRRAIVTSVVDRVVVNPARRGYNRPDPTKLAIEWRN